MLKLSVIIAGASDWESVQRCLMAIEQELHGMDAELILVRAAGPGVDANWLTKLKVIRVPAGCPESEMRLIGLQNATGDLLAVVGDRYEVQPGWSRAATQFGGDVTSGCVDACGLPLSGWAIYLAEYSHLAPPMHEEELTPAAAVSIPWGNVVYKRAAVEHRLGNTKITDLEFHSALFRDGSRFRQNPALLVTYTHPPSFREYLAERYRISRNWATGKSTRLSSPRRIASALLRVALPPLLLFRRGRNVFSRRRHRARFFAALPYLLLFSAVEFSGEFAGFIKGAHRR